MDPFEGSFQGFVNTGDAKLYVETAGEGQPMVFIHDGLIHREVWDAQFAYFSNQYKVVRYDRRGYGRSEPPQSVYSNVADLKALLEHLGIDRAIMMGVSAGGMIAVDLCLTYPENVEALVLIGSAISGFELSDHMIGQIQAAVKPLVEDDAVEQTIDNWCNDPYLVALENVSARKKFRELLTNNPHNLFAPHSHAVEKVEQQALGRLAEIMVPALIVVGESDRADNHAMSGALQAGIVNARRVVFPAAGHLVNLEQPEKFNFLVNEYLSDLIR